jgi:hypothetical protein
VKLDLATAKLKLAFTADFIFSTAQGTVNKLTLGTMCCATGCYLFFGGWKIQGHKFVAWIFSKSIVGTYKNNPRSHGGGLRAQIIIFQIIHG